MDVQLPFWSRVAYSQPLENLTLTSLARASHSAVLWRDNVVIYGGYQFPLDGYSYFFPSETNTAPEYVQVLQFLAEFRSWSVFRTYSSNESVVLIPTPRYGHTAVVYNVRINNLN